MPLGASLGVDGVVCTVLERGADGRLTGRLVGANCRGAEKARRVRAWLSEHGLDDAELWAYGDSAGDDELLALADRPLRVDGVRVDPEPR
jgi:phosphatidylglycerophosphatase C